MPGTDDFSAGQTLRRRVFAGERCVLAKVSGYDISDGSLQPEKLVARANTGPALGPPMPQQTPFAFASDGQLVLLCRDPDQQVRELRAGVWSHAQGEIRVEPGAVPRRLAELVIFPTYGPTAKLIAYEPRSPTTKIRPLSFKGPLDYSAAAKPTVSPSAGERDRLFDCEEYPWAAVGAGCSVDNTPTDSAVLKTSSSTPAATKCFTKQLGDAGVDLTDRPYMVLDLQLTGDLFDYNKPGLFLNDSALYDSGFEIGIYSDAACTTLIKKLTVPTLAPAGQVCRIAFHLGSLSEVAKGLAILTASHWEPPDSSDGRSLTVYSEAFADDWTHKGAYLFPEVACGAAPWVEKLPPDGTDGTSAAILQRFSIGEGPTVPKFRYCYTFCGRDRLSVLLWTHMVSNPSGDSAEVTADPWRSYEIAMSLPGTLSTVVTEYGDYVTHALVYRQSCDELGIWGDYEFIGAVPVGASMSYTDDGDDQEALVDGAEVPQVLELSNDFASSAGHAVLSRGRVYAGPLDWDPSAGRWRRPTAIQVSSYGKHWAFPTTSQQTSPVTDGTELDGYAETGAELRGLLTRNDDVLVFLDSEFFILRGDNLVGWHFIRQGSKGLRSARTLVDLRGVAIWHADDYFHLFAREGEPLPISRHKIDSQLIDWDAPHNAVGWHDQYVFFCHYGGEQALLRYDLQTDAWRVRTSQALDLVGICCAGEESGVWGITVNGDAVRLFGGDEDYGCAGGVPLREIWTQYLVLAGLDQEPQTGQLALDVVTDQANGLELAITLRGEGLRTNTQLHTLRVTSDRTTYRLPLNLVCRAVRIEIAYQGTTPPSIHGIHVYPNAVPAA